MILLFFYISNRNYYNFFIKYNLKAFLLYFFRTIKLFLIIYLINKYINLYLKV